ncbi:MAG: hypothetical protein ACR2ND_09640 [Solirubrobacteraceae bacterium]
MPLLPSFADLASDPEPAMDVLALAMAAEFRSVDARATIYRAPPARRTGVRRN